MNKQQSILLCTQKIQKLKMIESNSFDENEIYFPVLRAARKERKEGK